ncbi:MAG TPA: hypothetical protein VGH23_16070 [Rhizomicrobium sp.]|jgi:hypothetical protein
MSAESRRLVEASQTLGAIYLAGLRPQAICQRGKRIGPVKVEPCGYKAMLDLESLIWKCGAKYPAWRLPRFLKCPRCGGTSVEVAWMLGASPAARAGQDLYQCAVAAGKE